MLTAKPLATHAPPRLTGVSDFEALSVCLVAALSGDQSGDWGMGGF